MKTTLLLCAALALGLTSASAKVKQPSDDDVLQGACYPDVQRLCKDEIPDQAKITACMKRNKAKISKTCTDAYNKVHAKGR